MNGQTQKNTEEGRTYDHIERDRIHISPSVLDCRLREFEQYAHAHANIGHDIALLLTISIPLASHGLSDLLGLSAATISGAFTFGLIFMIAKTFYDILTVLREKKRSSRKALLMFLLQLESQPSWVSRFRKWAGLKNSH